jgi:hypothetical protein
MYKITHPYIFMGVSDFDILAILIGAQYKCDFAFKLND